MDGNQPNVFWSERARAEHRLVKARPADLPSPGESLRPVADEGAHPTGKGQKKTQDLKNLRTGLNPGVHFNPMAGFGIGWTGSVARSLEKYLMAVGLSLLGMILGCEVFKIGSRRMRMEKYLFTIGLQRWALVTEYVGMIGLRYLVLVMEYIGMIGLRHLARVTEYTGKIGLRQWERETEYLGILGVRGLMRETVYLEVIGLRMSRMILEGVVMNEMADQEVNRWTVTAYFFA